MTLLCRNKWQIAGILMAIVAIVIVQLTPLYELEGVVIGLLAALAFVFLSEGMGPTLSTAEAVERRLGVKVLGSISHKEG